jgi:hypothetical protein
MNIRVLSTMTICFFGILAANGQKQAVVYDLSVLAGQHKLDVHNREVTSFTDGVRKGIRFSAKENDGVAWLEGVTFSNGIIELDIRGKDVLQQSFVGVAFHGIDETNLDAIYFRPFNFQSEDPVRKIHAVQYVSHPLYTWNKLREERNGKYEKGIILAPKATDWFHAKIVLKYPMVTVYVNNSTEPSLTIEQLSDRKTGRIGLWVGNNSDGDFSNLKITTSN